MESDPSTCHRVDFEASVVTSIFLFTESSTAGFVVIKVCVSLVVSRLPNVDVGGSSSAVEMIVDTGMSWYEDTEMTTELWMS